MVKTLVDGCYQAIASSISDHGNLLLDLPSSYREVLIGRIFAHDLLFTQYWNPISKYVIKSCNIGTLNITHSAELKDHHLEVLGNETSNLVKVKLNYCSSITDEGLLR